MKCNALLIAIPHTLMLQCEQISTLTTKRFLSTVHLYIHSYVKENLEPSILKSFLALHKT